MADGSTAARAASPTDRLALLLLLAATTGYLLHAVLLVMSGRHLYGDSSWFLIRIASEGVATSFVDDWVRHFYHARTLAFWITQGPAVAALHLGLRDLQSLSIVLGCTYVGLKVLSLLLCYWLLPSGEKLFFVFPALGLFAGTINSDIYLVSETHLAVAIAWPLLIELRAHPSGGSSRDAIVAGVILGSSLIHESFVAFGSIMLCVLLWRRRVASRTAAGRTNALAVLLALSCAVNLLGILLPRDPVNKAAFAGGLLKILTDSLGSLGDAHAGPVASMLAVGMLLVVVFLPEHRARPSVGVALQACCVLLALAPLVHFVVFVDRARFEDAITDRGFSGGAMQVLLMGAYLAVGALGREAFFGRAAAVVAVVGSLAIGQLAWQIFATHVWREAVWSLRQRLASAPGLHNCPSLDAATAAVHARADKVLCKWWVTPLSVVLSYREGVRSMMLSTDSFQAFDPRNSEGLPSLRYVGPRYERYVAALGDERILGPSEKVLFGTGGRGYRMVREGFARPEGGAAWTDGERASLEVCGLSARGKDTSVRLLFHVVPFTPPGGAPPEASFSVGGQAGTWRFGPGEKEAAREVVVPGAAIPSSGCVDLRFRIDNPRSPEALGLSKDPRRLGLAFVDLQRTDVASSEAVAGGHR